MKILDLEQGSPEWLEARSKHYTASEAPAMMGQHPQVSRNDLLRARYSGWEKEISQYVREKLFDFGHQVEAIVREAIEAELGEDLFSCMVVDDAGYLSASLDGMTLDGSTIWEHKQFNQGKVEHMEGTNSVPPADHWQVQQQLLITGAKRCLYTVGNDPDDLARLWVEPDPEAFKALQAGWAQFDQDLADYEPLVDEAQAVGHTMESLPALRIEVTGMVTASNLAKYKDHALTVFGSINTDLQTDQDFADAESTVKWCKEVEDRLEAAKQHALSQTESIDELFRTIDDLRESARTKRLELDKLVKARKATIRDEIRQAGEKALAEHMAGLEKRLEGRVRLPRPDADFAAAMKGKRTISSLRDAVDQVLATAKIDANAAADEVQLNLKAFDELAGEHTTLFPDIERLVFKPSDDFQAAVKLRIADYKEAEAKRLAEAEERGRLQADAAARRAEEARQAEEARRAKEAEDARIASGSDQAVPVKTEPPAFEAPRASEASRTWRVTATFEFSAPEKYGPEEIAGRLKARLVGFDALTGVKAEDITEAKQEAA